MVDVVGCRYVVVCTLLLLIFLTCSKNQLFKSFLVGFLASRLGFTNSYVDIKGGK